jgi:hypothetical protein
MVFSRAPRRFDQPPRHVRIERVAPVGPVHGDGEQALVELLKDHFVVHEVLPLLLLVVLSSFRDGALAPDPESRDSGFDASHRPGMTAS